MPRSRPPLRSRRPRSLVPEHAVGLQQRSRRPEHRRLGRLVGRPEEQRLPRSDHRQRGDPRDEPEAGHRADPGAREPRRRGQARAVRERERDRRSRTNLPKIIGRGLAAADFDNNGQVGVAINTIGGQLVLLQNTGPIGNWLDVSLAGFHPDAVVTAVLPERAQARPGSSTRGVATSRPRIRDSHFGLGDATKVS